MALLTHKLDSTGLSQVWAAIILNFVAKKDFNALKDIVDAMERGAQVNVIEKVSVNGAELSVVDKKVNITVPTGTLAGLDKVSENELDAALANLINGKADKADSLAGYGIKDAFTKEEVNTELGKKADTASTLAGYGINNAFTKDETYSKEQADAVMDQKIKAATTSCYKVKGSVNSADLSLEGAASGDMYNVRDAFTTTSDFVEGEGAKYPAGTNVAAVNVGTEEDPEYKWDAQAGTYDFSDFVKTGDIVSMTEEEIAAICVLPATE